MPELDPQPVNATVINAASALAPSFRSLPGFGALERLSAREAAYWGHRYGLDTEAPYLWAPSGWGEDVELIGDLSGVPPENIHEGRPT